MRWIKIIHDLPVENSLVYVKLENKSDEILCNYKDDSFGLGDYDFRVIKWKYALPIYDSLSSNPLLQSSIH